MEIAEVIFTYLMYPFRRLVWFVISPEPACRERLCPRPIVGYSVWCREHTDRILHG